MREVGIDISAEYSKPLTNADLGWADIVVALKKSHLAHLAEDYPSLASKFRYLGRDIRDPYRGSLQRYRATRDDIDNLFRTASKTLLYDTPQTTNKVDTKKG
jgi:protein-tyrosine-phosphatase